MSCWYCGTELPAGALFCGECGQPVADPEPSVLAPSVPAPSVPAPSVPEPSVPAPSDSAHSAPATVGFSIADLAFSSPGETSEPDDDDRELPDGSAPDPAVAPRPAPHCPQCGEPMAEGDVFCGECGFVVRTVAPPTGSEAAVTEPQEAPDADATTEIDPLSDDEAPADIDELVIERESVFAAVAADSDPDLDFDDPLPFSELEAAP
ncbi:MAG: zinc-ribbon domain-containing protein, partial [Leifsonia sp.]